MHLSAGNLGSSNLQQGNSRASVELISVQFQGVNGENATIDLEGPPPPPSPMNRSVAKGLTINIEALLQLGQEGGGVLSLHLVHAQLLLQVQHKAAQEGHKVLGSPDVSRYLSFRIAQAIRQAMYIHTCIDVHG